jgi:hypothetical protein
MFHDEVVMSPKKQRCSLKPALMMLLILAMIIPNTRRVNKRNF